MFRFELKKYRKKNIALLVLFLIAVQICISCKTMTVREEFGTEIYREYMMHLEGALTPEKEAWIWSEEQRLVQILNEEKEMEQRYMEGEIGFEEYVAFNEELTYAKAQKSAFEAVREKYLYFRECDEDVQFFYDLDMCAFAGTVFNDDILKLLILFITAIAVEEEYRGDIQKIRECTQNGGNVFWRVKLLTLLLVISGFVLLFIGIDLAVYASHYSFENWDMPIHSVQVFQGTAGNLPFCWGMIQLFFCKWGISVLTALVTASLARFFRRLPVTVFVAAILSYVPSITGNYLPVVIGETLIAKTMFLQGAIGGFAAAMLLCLLIFLGNMDSSGKLKKRR